MDKHDIGVEPIPSLIDGDEAAASRLISVAKAIGINTAEIKQVQETNLYILEWAKGQPDAEMEALAHYLSLFKKSDASLHMQPSASLISGHHSVRFAQMIAKHHNRLNDSELREVTELHSAILKPLIEGTGDYKAFPLATAQHNSYMAAVKMINFFIKNPKAMKVDKSVSDDDLDRLVKVPGQKSGIFSTVKGISRLGIYARSTNSAEDVSKGITDVALKLEASTTLRLINCAKLSLTTVHYLEPKFSKNNRLLQFLDNVDNEISTALKRYSTDPAALAENFYQQLHAVMDKFDALESKLSNKENAAKEYVQSAHKVISMIFEENLYPMRSYRESVTEFIAPDKAKQAITEEILEVKDALNIDILEETEVKSASKLEKQEEAIDAVSDETQQKIDSIKVEAQEIVYEQLLMMQPWRLSNKAIRNLGLLDVVHTITRGEQGIEGVLRDKATEYVSTITVLFDNYMKYGQDGSKHLLAESINSEELRSELLNELHMQHKQLTSLNGFPKIDDTLSENIGWIIENWPELQKVLDSNIAATGFSEILSKILDLELTKVEPDTEEDVNPNVLSESELAELAQLEAEEELQRQADEAEFTRLVEEDAQRRAEEEAQILAELEATEESVPEATEEDVKDIGDIALNLPSEELIDIADELEFEVFPTGASLEELKIKARHLNPDMTITDWGRIEDLKRIADAAKGELYISRQTLSSGKTPYYVAVFNLADETIAVAENPVEGNATYIIRESLTPGNWQEVLRLPKRLARQVGAAQTVHRNGKDHVKKIMDRIQRLLTVKHYEITSK